MQFLSNTHVELERPVCVFVEFVTFDYSIRDNDPVGQYFKSAQHAAQSQLVETVEFVMFDWT